MDCCSVTGRDPSTEGVGDGVDFNLVLEEEGLDQENRHREGILACRHEGGSALSPGKAVGAQENWQERGQV